MPIIILSERSSFVFNVHETNGERIYWALNNLLGTAVMRLRYVVAISLLIVSPVYAVDEDYVIPYTDTYDYVYDPETGQYIKQEKPSVEGAVAVAGHTSSQETSSDSVSAIENNGNQGATELGGVSDQSFRTFLILILIAGMVLGLIKLYLWLSRKKAIA